jgi:hypothetical protein
MRNGFILALNHAHLPVGMSEEPPDMVHSVHVLLMAAVPVVCAFIGTTQLGWNFGDGTIIKLSMRKPPEPPPSAAHGAYSDEKWFHSRS